MAQEQDVLLAEYRRMVIDQINGSENRMRKKEALRRHEVLKHNLEPYLLAALGAEYAESTIKGMRKITSINPASRAVDEMASIYKQAPERNFNGVNESQETLLKAHYRRGRFNVKLKRANRYFKGLRQCAIQVVPEDGVITAKVYAPHQYDVIPREDNPEKAFAYIINTMDQDDVPMMSDNQNQEIADPDDSRRRQRYIWWTDQLNFITDGEGRYVRGLDDPESVLESTNPIGRLPFIDVAELKDFSFWITDGSPAVDFAIDFAVLLSDTGTVNRNQGFSQGVFSSVNKPESIEVGRQRILWIEQNPDAGSKDPKFEFVTPAPDLDGSLKLLETYVRLWLTCMGMDPKTISGEGESRTYSSGLERLLAMLERFEASSDDIDMFRAIEDGIFALIVLWNNAYQGADKLVEELRGGSIPETATLDAQFKEPQIVQTKAEKEDSLIKLKDKGIVDDVDVVMSLEGVEEDKAIELIVARKVRVERIKKLVSERLKAEGLPEPSEEVGRESEENSHEEKPNEDAPEDEDDDIKGAAV